MLCSFLNIAKNNQNCDVKQNNTAEKFQFGRTNLYPIPFTVST